MFLSLLAAGIAASITAESPRVTSVLIEPAEVVLTDADQSVQFLVTLKMSDGTLRDGTRQAEYSIQLAEGSGSAESIAAVEHGRLLPKGDGAVMVLATVVDPVSQKKVGASAKA